jgi:hypothetical protein
VASIGTMSLPIGQSARPASFKCAPGERDADDLHGEKHGVDEMREGEPPAGEDEPDEMVLREGLELPPVI